MKLILYISLVLLALSGFAQTGPAGVGKTDGSSSLELWLDADNMVFIDTAGQNGASANTRVKLWKDKSGNGLRGMSVADSMRPTYSTANPAFNNAGALRFTRNAGIDNKKTTLLIDTFPKGKDYTIFAVFHPLSAGGGNDDTPVVGTGFNAGQWYGGAGIIDSDVKGIGNDLGLSLSNTSIAFGAGDVTTSTDYTIKKPLLLNTSYFAVASFSGTAGTLELEINGGSKGNIPTTTNERNSSQIMTIGSTSILDENTANNYFDGYIASVSVFSKILTEAERILVSNYLSSKYNIPLLSNDLYTMDESARGDFDHEMAGIGIASDGSKVIEARGEGIFTISNPSDLSGSNKFLLWGHVGSVLNGQNNSDVPKGISYRLSRIWACSESGGDLGKVDISLDTSAIKVPSGRKLVLLIDKNGNDNFADDSLIVLNRIGDTFSFKGLELEDKWKFTFGISEKEKIDVPLPVVNNTSDVLTPNGDGIADTYWVEGNGEVKIYDKYGHLIRELNAPVSWDGTKSNGELAAPGFYQLVIGEKERKHLNIIH